MKVYIGADHRGYNLAQTLVSSLKDRGVEVELVGEELHKSDDDYVDFGRLVGEKVSQDASSQGITICGSGAGIAIAANKVRGIRSALGYSVAQVKSARNDDDVNVLALGADFINEEQAKELVKAFLDTPFAKEERFMRRIEKLRQLEQ